MIKTGSVAPQGFGIKLPVLPSSAFFSAVATIVAQNVGAGQRKRAVSFICFAHSIAATFLIRIPVTWLMSRVSTDSLLPMGLAAPAASLFSIVICLLYFWRHESRLKRTAEEHPAPEAGGKQDICRAGK